MISFILVLLSMACVSKYETDRVLIVYEDQYKLIGEIHFSLSGELLYAWTPDNIVIFRVDRRVWGESGRKGKIYRIGHSNKLEEIGIGDLSKTDHELAEQFGIKKDAPSVTTDNFRIGS